MKGATMENPSGDKRKSGLGAGREECTESFDIIPSILEPTEHLILLAPKTTRD